MAATVVFVLSVIRRYRSLILVCMWLSGFLFVIASTTIDYRDQEDRDRRMVQPDQVQTVELDPSMAESIYITSSEWFDFDVYPSDQLCVSRSPALDAAIPPGHIGFARIDGSTVWMRIANLEVSSPGPHQVECRSFQGRAYAIAATEPGTTLGRFASTSTSIVGMVLILGIPVGAGAAAIRRSYRNARYTRLTGWPQ